MDKKGTAPVRTEEERKLVLDILKCVKLLRGGFGRHAAAAVLLGSKKEAILEHDLQELEVYGAQAAMDRSRLIEVIDALTDQGLIVSRGAEYPVCLLSRKGWEVLHSGVVDGIFLPVREPEEDRESAHYAGLYDRDLYERLKRIRDETASAVGRPAHAIVPRDSLKAVSRFMPQTVEELRLLKGFGVCKLEGLGLRIVEEVRRHARREAPCDQARAEDGFGSQIVPLRALG